MIARRGCSGGRRSRRFEDEGVMGLQVGCEIVLIDVNMGHEDEYEHEHSYGIKLPWTTMVQLL